MTALPVSPLALREGRSESRFDGQPLVGSSRAKVGGPTRQGAARQARFRLPGALPPGEHVLWQGAPDWRGLACGALHLRAVAAYFVLLVASVAIAAAWRDEPAASVVFHAARAALLACLPLALGLAYAWFAARGAAYTITNRRVVLRIGVALTINLNLPFAKIDAADLATRRDGSGDIALRLVPGTRALGWAILWPHARPWRFAAAQPMLRAIPDAAAAGQALARALAEFNAQPVPVAPAPGKLDSADCQHGATAVAA